MYFTELPNFETEILNIIGSYSEQEFVLTNKRKIDNIKYLCTNCNKYHIQENYLRYIPRSYDKFNQLMENVYNNEFHYDVNINDNNEIKNFYPLCIECFRSFLLLSVPNRSALPLIVDEFDEIELFNENKKVISQIKKDNKIIKFNTKYFEERYQSDIQKLMKKNNDEIYDINILKNFYNKFHYQRKKHLKDSRIQRMYLKNKRIKHKKRKFNFFTKIFRKK